MKKLILLLCMTAMLTGCGNDAGDDSSDKRTSGTEKNSSVDEETSESEKTSENETVTENAWENTTAAVTTEVITTAPVTQDAVESPAEQVTYRSVLEGIYYDRILPDGNSLPDDGYDITANEFAVCDVDGDGRDELIFMYSNSAMAGMFARVYDHDGSGGIKAECGGFPSMRFYDSGVIESDISHNQGYSGEFWPYTLYKYDPGTDKYNRIAFVEAMDKNLVDRVNSYAAEYGSENPVVYPQEADTSGSGFVYYISPEGTDGDVPPVDVTEYEAWHEQFVGGADQIYPVFMKLTEENIKTINK